MKVPVTRDELGNGSFTSIAKYVARHWPGDNPLSLANAQNVVATILGYDDLHDLQKSATDRFPTGTPTLQQVQDLATSRLTERHGLSTEKAAAFVQRWPLSKLRFAQAPVGGRDCPVTRHKSWRYLLRELAPLPEFRWLTAMPTERAMIALQPVVALARAIALWQPDLIEHDQLSLDLIGATEIECIAGGRYYGLLPQLWGRTGMRIDVHLVGPEVAKRLNADVPSGLPPFKTTIINRIFDDYRNSAPEYRQPDLTVIANPGLSDFETGVWLLNDDCLLEVAERHPLVWLGYDWDDAEYDQMVMQAFGLQTVGRIDRNPFFVEGSGDLAGATITYGMASWCSPPGVRKVSDAQRDRIMRQIDRVAEFSTVSSPDIRSYNTVIAQVRALGELQKVEQADGRMDQVIVLGKSYYARPEDGMIVDIPTKGARPGDTGLRIEGAWMASYPGQADARWIDRACWVAQVWLDILDEFDGRLLFRQTGDESELEDWMAEGFDALLGGMGLDASAMQQLRAALVPAKRKTIRREHKPFVQVLNDGDFAQACAMLKTDPTLAAAENDEGQTALFYACRADAVELAAAFADAGGDLEHPDRESWSALSDAARNNCPRVIALLAERGIDIEHGSALGWTPLQVALSHQAPEAAAALAEAGADLDLKGLAGWTAREFATEFGLTAVLEAGKRAAGRPR